MTAGQDFANEIRTMLHIGPRTRWYRKSHGETLIRESIIERVLLSVQNPGYDNEARTAKLSVGYAALNAWVKHVEGYRIDPVLRARIADQAPWKFAGYLGEMVDSGCGNNGEFELWFSAQR